MSFSILHIEDNLSDAELIKIALENAYTKLKLHQTYNKSDFINCLKSNQYDIILSDYNLPDMIGIEIYELTIKYAPNTPFIFVSGTIGEERAVEILKSGVTDYVLKGNLGKLPLAINRAINEIKEINQKQIAEEKIKFSEERYRSLIENSSEITCVINKKGIIKYISPSIKHILGYEEAELLGTAFFDFYHPDDKQEALKTFKIVIKKEYGVTRYGIYRFITSYEKYRYLRLMITDHLETHSIKGFIINAQDITELVESEKEKQIAIIKTEETERQRISNDLHDGLGQTIAAANMCINTLESYAKKELSEEALKIFEIAKKLINESAKETRLVSHNIMPRSLREFGLYSCIDSILKNYKEFYKDISFKVESNITTMRFKNEVELSIFRVAQESINNALKHSKATHIKVTLNMINGNLIMIVEDNGIGFSNKNSKNKGMGLMSIKQRIEAIEGKVSIKSVTGKGTTISIAIDTIKPLTFQS